jgi:hypothetical protein
VAEVVPLRGHTGGGRADGGRIDGGRIDGGRIDGGRPSGGHTGGGRADGGRASGSAARLAEVATVIRGAGLDGLVRPASQPVDAPSTTNEILPVIPALRPLLPWGGLRRGSTIAVAGAAGQLRPDPAGGQPSTSLPKTRRREARQRGVDQPAPRLRVVPDAPVAPEAQAEPSGATSALLCLLSAASAGGSWCAVVGLPALGAVAAGEFGVSLDRLALVPYPGPDWPAVVAALLDGFDLVVAGAPGPVAGAVASRLSARARQRGSVLVATGEWSGAEVTFTPVASAWAGLGQGRGRLVRRELTVAAQGRGAAARTRYAQLVLPPTTVPATTAPESEAGEQLALEAVGA